MCYDINPLGTTMHLRELDRQIARSRDVLPTVNWFGMARHKVAVLRVRLTAFLRLVALNGGAGTQMRVPQGESPLQ